ncbi:addiction module toxin, HicA family [Candidatus Falkowbacteria bacterium]|jgi:predicted RNA binding protein YcfA (HicA-like mRNA interferase family)|nr:addiction module toxin, HicA family [Candidatus Falkowbacteria bacterium]
MPSLSELPGEIKRKKLAKALKRLGFIINKKGGDGSHIKIVWPSTQKCITLPEDLKKQTLYYILKEIENYSGITWEQIKEKM